MGRGDAIELAGEVVATADERADLAGGRLHDDHGHLEAPPGIPTIARRHARFEPIEPTRGRGLREPLQAQVERRHDAHAPDARDARVEALFELLADVVDEVRRRLPGAHQRAHPNRRAASALVLVRRDHLQIAHLGQDGVAMLARAIRVDRRRVDVGAADDRRDQGRLGRRQLMNLFAEVGARRRAHAPDRDRPALTQVDLVQVGLEDPLFRIARLDQRGQPRFAKLSEERPLRIEQADLDQLLRDRAPAFLDTSGAKVGPCRPQERAKVDAAVLEEPVVLGREHGVDQHSRCLVQLDGLVVLARPIRGAREHLGLEHGAGDVLTRARDPGDALVGDLQAQELAAARVVATPQIDVPATA